MASFAHQDWTPVVIHKPKPLGVEQKATPPHLQKTKQERALDSDDAAPPPKFEREFIQKVIGARVARKWVQKDLAMALREPLARIANFEQGKEVYDGKLKDKINRVLFPPERK